MQEKNIISSSKGIVRKIKVLNKKRNIIRHRFTAVEKKLGATVGKLTVAAKEKEGVKRKLAVTVENLRVLPKKREAIRHKLGMVEKKLFLKAQQLAKIAKEKEEARKQLVATAQQLANTAKKKEGARLKLTVVAKQLAATAKEKKKAAELIESTNKKLRLLDLAKDEFVTIASHQLRTPLTALKGYAGMLLDEDVGPINDKQREYLVEIENANNRMINLITALLNVSRVDLGVFVVEPEQVNLEQVAESVLSDLGTKIQDKKLRVKTDFEKGLPLIKADLKIIRMIFENLFTNAVKYTPPGRSMTVNIKKDGSNVLISVADTGYGIPKNAQSKIFTKMFRADNVRIKDPDGTGLGLYIIKETIEKTGGKIWFESKENKGSTFYVRIPLKGMRKKEGTKRLQ
jgi:signal transduction histidine kinase